MSNIRVVSHFSTKSEKERKQSFNELAKMMVVAMLHSGRTTQCKKDIPREKRR